MMRTPTTLPWHHDGNGLIYGQCSGPNDDAPCIVDVIVDRERAALGILTDVEQTNAAFIIRVCNLHEESIACLRVALLALNVAARFRVRESDSYAIAASIGNLLTRLEEDTP
jgi:hypothetical protein